jgi:hypothetical protein
MTLGRRPPLADPQAGPWMPRIQQLPKLGIVGVLKPCCTTRSGRTPQSDTSHQHQRCLCPHSPRGRLRYAGHASATANLKLTFHLDRSARADRGSRGSGLSV